MLYKEVHIYCNFLRNVLVTTLFLLLIGRLQNKTIVRCYFCIFYNKLRFAIICILLAAGIWYYRIHTQVEQTLSMILAWKMYEREKLKSMRYIEFMRVCRKLIYILCFRTKGLERVSGVSCLILLGKSNIYKCIKYIRMDVHTHILYFLCIS